MGVWSAESTPERRWHARFMRFLRGDDYDLSPGVSLHSVLYLGLLPDAAMSCFRWISDPAKCHKYITFLIASSESSPVSSWHVINLEQTIIRKEHRSQPLFSSPIFSCGGGGGGVNSINRVWLVIYSEKHKILFLLCLWVAHILAPSAECCSLTNPLSSHYPNNTWHPLDVCLMQADFANGGPAVDQHWIKWVKLSKKRTKLYENRSNK